MEPQDVMDAVDIVDYIGQYTELKPIGGGEYKGLSPFNNERTPSFFVNADKQRFYDYSAGGGRGGNVAEFVKCIEGCGFMEAIDILRRYAGITDDTAGLLPRRLNAESVAKKYRHATEKPAPVHQILPDDIMDNYVWDEEKLKPWHDEDISWEAMRKFQVRYDPVSNRIMYPIRDMNGRVINVAGRTLVADYKERGLRKYTYIYPLGTLDTLCCYWENRAEIAEKKEIIIFEGAKSVMKCSGWGINNAAAICTSHLNPAQFAILVKLGVSAVFALDAEVDVRQDPNVMKLLPFIPVYEIRNWDKLLDDKDAPVDKGEEVFEVLYRNRVRL